MTRPTPDRIPVQSVRYFVVRSDRPMHSFALSLPSLANTWNRHQRRTLLAGQQTGSHFFDVVAQLSTFYTTIHRKPGDLIASFHPGHLTLATKANLARYAIKSRDRKVDLNLGADRRAFRAEDEHATQTHIPGVPSIVVFCAVGPVKQDGHQESKPVKGPAINRTMHFDFRLVATRDNIPSKPVGYKRVIVRGEVEGCPLRSSGYLFLLVADRGFLREGLTSAGSE
jgi:hypothetical protein